MNTSLVSDLSDAVPVCPQLELYLKPIAKVNISVGLPKLKVFLLYKALHYFLRYGIYK